MLLDYFQVIQNFLYVCQSVSLLTSLLKFDKCKDISSSGWDIFLEFFVDIPVMLVHLFQIIMNFLYVCQSVGWLTSLLKLYKYRDISSSGWDIFLNFFEISPGCWYTSYKWFWISCMSVSLFVCLLPYWNKTKGYLQFWRRYLSGIFWRPSWGVGTLDQNNSD